MMARNAHEIMSSFNAQPKAPASSPMSGKKRAGAFGWALNDGVWPVAVAIILLVSLRGSALAIELPAADAESLKAAQDAFDNGKHKEAINLLLPLNARYPEHGDIPRLLTHAYYALGEFQKARQTALQAIGAGRLSPDVLGRLAQIDQQRDDQLALINIVRLLTILDSDNRQWRLIYADLLTDASEFAESAAAYRKLLEDEPESAQLHVRLGNALLQQDRLEEAALALETAWHLGASQDKLPTMLADLWLRIGDDAEACAWTERAASSGEQLDERRLLLLSQMLLSLGRLDRSAKHAEVLVNSQDRDIKGQAHVLLGQIAMRRGHVDQAIHHWRQAEASGVDSPKLLAVMGGYYYNSGDFEQAAELLKRVVDAEGGKDEPHLRFLIVSLLQCGDKAVAREYLRLYVEHHGLSDGAKSLIQLMVN